MTFLSQNDNSIYRYIFCVMLYLILSALIYIIQQTLAPQNIKRTGIYMTMYIVNWQNVILRHHANVHGGSSDLLAKPLDYIFVELH